jgi:nucleoside-diphosphate-sugar epimerase
MVLVTGSAGLLGSELIKQLLAKGEKIRAIYNKVKPDPVPGVDFIACSVLDTSGLEEVMEGIEDVYHCAALVSFAKNGGEALYKINVEGTANVVNASLDAGIRKLVHVSSVAALGRMRNDETVNEKMQWTETTSNSKYGRSKYLGELEVWRGIAEGLNAVIINPVIILGNGNIDEGSTGIFKSAYNEFPWYSEGVSGFVDVRDVASAMIMLMQSEVHSERFILSAYNLSYKEVFTKIAGAFNKRSPTRKVTPFLASVVWRLQAVKALITGSKPLLTRETAATAQAKVFYDNSKLLTAFPSFAYRSFDETIRDTCRSLQQKLNKL